MKDPEVSPYIIETVKMKGVEEFGDFGIQLSFAFMTKPGYQSVVRRRAYTVIREAFMANGIEFAQPTVQVGNEEKSAAARRIRNRLCPPEGGAKRLGGGLIYADWCRPRSALICGADLF